MLDDGCVEQEQEVPGSAEEMFSFRKVVEQRRFDVMPINAMLVNPSCLSALTRRNNLFGGYQLKSMIFLLRISRFSLRV
jgi:hypothetical protein